MLNTFALFHEKMKELSFVELNAVGGNVSKSWIYFEIVSLPKFLSVLKEMQCKVELHVLIDWNVDANYWKNIMHIKCLLVKKCQKLKKAWFGTGKWITSKLLLSFFVIPMKKILKF